LTIPIAQFFRHHQNRDLNYWLSIFQGIIEWTTTLKQSFSLFCLVNERFANSTQKLIQAIIFRKITLPSPIGTQWVAPCPPNATVSRPEVSVVGIPVSTSNGLECGQLMSQFLSRLMGK